MNRPKIQIITNYFKRFMSQKQYKVIVKQKVIVNKKSQTLYLEYHLNNYNYLRYLFVKHLRSNLTNPINPTKKQIERLVLSQYKNESHGLK